jgi:hypothetical protein
MSTTTSTVTIIAANAALLFAVVGLQTLWITRGLDQIYRRLDRLEKRLDDMFRVLLEHGERITRLEERT